MKVDGKNYRSIWGDESGAAVNIIDQTLLPHAFVTRKLKTLEDAAEAIGIMRVRGAPLIGATAAYGLALAMLDDPDDARLEAACARLIETRPTAVNLRWAVEMVREALLAVTPGERAGRAWALAAEICDEDVAINHAIGLHGLEIIRKAWQRKGQQAPLHILTHCNAGWLATVDWGTALAPIYQAHDAGIPVHVWVDETRPRNQGAALTAWELAAHGVPYDVIVDNAGGHLMQQGLVDLCITGTDRTARNGDVCNKVGTYLKALAAADNGVSFYVALPGPTIDWLAAEGITGIPIEERDAREITHVTGMADDGQVRDVRITPRGAGARNYAFDVTPARLVTGLITERGACTASEEGLLGLYPEQVG
ncbi:MAG: S-methyl-5-thioribose-1-phosphate isomerase [Lysobacterales bacterium]|jgi:methylthioribose-1-phosphate isomerase